MDLGTLPDWLVAIGTLALAVATAHMSRVASRGIKYDIEARREDQSRRDDEAVRQQDHEASLVTASVSMCRDLDSGFSLGRVILLAWPPSYEVNGIEAHEFWPSSNGDPARCERVFLQTVKRRVPGAARIEWPVDSQRAGGSWLLLFTDPYGTRRAVYGDDTGSLKSLLAPREKNATEVARDALSAIRTGPAR